MEPAPTSAVAIPTTAFAEWSELTAQIAAAGSVPCQRSDPEAWWPDKANSYAAQTAVDACSVCPARTPCLAYAVAADERFGIWGGRFQPVVAIGLVRRSVKTSAGVR
ncbi:Transcription factor WhiB [Modestobacter sp. DSM 44400]|uniref:WhiB family transcriptional regulator n=1 Tax=Modestobacter sp. DSM 44400 TaxID=1550230 RepID=UPI000899649E|nr:Transcription factor WhiB [Modestobacter sp. DSM 44400]